MHDFAKFLKHDLLNFKIGSYTKHYDETFHDNFLNFLYVLTKSLDDTLYRLNSKVFCFYNNKSVGDEFLFYDTRDIIEFLFGTKIIEDWYYSESNTKEDFKNVQFLKSEIFKSSINSKIKINLSFDLANKVFKKYFEFNFTKERYDKIYPDFRIFLKVLFNKATIETQIKTLDLTEEDVKKMIVFFAYFKTDTEYPNTIFTYKVDDLIEFLEQISGIDGKKETWKQSHKPSNITVKRIENLVKQINSIIPEKSAVKKRFTKKMNPLFSGFFLCIPIFYNFAVIIKITIK